MVKKKFGNYQVYNLVHFQDGMIYLKEHPSNDTILVV